MPLRALSNPPNPWASTEIEWLGEPPVARQRVYLEQARSLITENSSPDIPYRFGVNPYRGCAHACAYCYARPTHEYLGFGAGTDFDSQLVVKENAAALLEQELERGITGGEVLVFSGITDPYQPLEAEFRLTQRLLEICLAHDQPVALITKGALIRRDKQLLARLAQGPGLHVHVSLPTLDTELARALEPGAPTPAVRLRALAELSELGIETGVSLAPLIPGLNDQEGPALLEAAAAAGARRAFRTLLRLPGSVETVFFERLRAALPGRVEKIEHALREMRGGGLKEARFHERMRGRGARFEASEQLLILAARRLGIQLGESEGPSLPPRKHAPPKTIRKPAPADNGQGLLCFE